MLLIRFLGIIALCGVPCTAWAQPWADAYRAGDYQKAVDLLQPLVIDLEHQPADPGPARHLAMLYAQGLGVPRDPVVACGMAHIAGRASLMAIPKTLDEVLTYKTFLAESGRFTRQYCDGLTPPELASAARTMACPAFGLRDELLTLDSQTISVGRAGIRLAEAPAEIAMPILDCPQIVARVRALTLSPPADAAPGVTARHFVELLAWGIGKNPHDGGLRCLLRRQMYEMRGETLKIVALDELYSTDTYPQPALPADFDARSSLEMIRSGHVRWRMDGAPPKRGWILLPEKTR